MTDARITNYPRWQCTWLAEEIAQLHHGSNLGQTAEEIAVTLGRTAKSIREKCSALGLAVRPRPESHWSDERLEYCKRLYQEGHSATASAHELGITRNAVIGKWHRRPDLFPPRPHIVNGRSTVKKIRVRGQRKPRQHRAAPVPQFISEEITELPADQSRFMVSLADLDEWNHCRWPLGHPPVLMYCGAQKDDPSATYIPYCSRHCRIAYQPPKYRRAV